MSAVSTQEPTTVGNGISKMDSQLERLQTRIEMIRAESRVLSFKIERMEQQRKDLSEEKRVLKQSISVISGEPTNSL